MLAATALPSTPALRVFATPLCLLLAILAGAFLVEVERQRAYDERAWGGYGTPIRASAVDALGTPTTIVLTESRIEPPPVRWQEKWSNHCTWWKFAAERVLHAPFASPDKR